MQQQQYACVHAERTREQESVKYSNVVFNRFCRRTTPESLKADYRTGGSGKESQRSQQNAVSVKLCHFSVEIRQLRCVVPIAGIE